MVKLHTPITKRGELHCPWCSRYYQKTLKKIMENNDSALLECRHCGRLFRIKVIKRQIESDVYG